MRYLMLAAASAFAFAGCVAVVPVDGTPKFTDRASDRKSGFIPAEYAPYDGVGTASIEGQVIHTRSDGVKFFGAGNKVVLNPVTSYSTEWLDRVVLDGEWLEENDPRASRYTFTTIADVEGRFRFEKLMPGEYYVTSSLSLSSPRVHDSGIGGKYTDEHTKTAVVLARVRITAGEAKTLRMSPKGK